MTVCWNERRGRGGGGHTMGGGGGACDAATRHPLYGHPPPIPSKTPPPPANSCFSRGIEFQLSSVQNHTRAKTKKPKIQSLTENAGTVLFFWIFVFFWIFGFLVFTWQNQKSKNPKNQKSKTVPTFSVKLWIFVFLVLGASLFQSRPLPLYK